MYLRTFFSNEKQSIDKFRHTLAIIANPIDFT